MHFGAYRARHGACRAVGGPAPTGELARVFTDGKRIPDLQLSMPEHRYTTRRAAAGHRAREIRSIQRQYALGEPEPEMLHQNPRSQRPRGIVSIPHGQNQFSHAFSPLKCPPWLPAPFALSASILTIRSGT